MVIIVMTSHSIVMTNTPEVVTISMIVMTSHTKVMTIRTIVVTFTSIVMTYDSIVTTKLFVVMTILTLLAGKTIIVTPNKVLVNTKKRAEANYKTPLKTISWQFQYSVVFHSAISLLVVLHNTEERCNKADSDIFGIF